MSNVLQAKSVSRYDSFQEFLAEHGHLYDSVYIVRDISREEWREVVFKDFIHRINAPIALIIRRGGKTHRVVDKQGVTHCYAAPEHSNNVLRWKKDDRNPAVDF